MNSNPNHDHPEWGIKLNLTQQPARTTAAPAWLKGWQREDWCRRGVVVWSKEQQEVTHWQGRQALRVLKELRSDDAWQQNGITIGNPATRLQLPVEDKRRRGSKQEPRPAEPPAQPEHVLINTIKLTGAQTQHLFAVLNAAEEDLHRMADAEERAEREALGKIVALILAEHPYEGKK
ncbi:hypothetical protein EYB53_011085 [Candidatus Chloroploca sp. M-50]|uniref:Uncharacterized protein n=1 Tax=Candidatus Chloroploca mongolica TaxID=2528176 RepID=A0ABS4DA11_9CHLR|nr:hypothetical protein [Candidatus Chloroploca mongolica]MBP1466250.1 hypothetical protein [Candidatus Chloroploca mongolica]